MRTLDAGEEAGVHDLVLEYLEGTDLSKLVKQQGPLSVANALLAIRQAALGIQHAHEQGLVHRDIKPANLMLHRPKVAVIAPRDEPSSRDSRTLPNTSSPNTKTTSTSSERQTSKAPHAEREGYREAVIKVMDFGLALLTDGNSLTELTKSGQIMGTPEYMAPEQWESTHQVDARADLYSLGATLHFLLTGRSPYRTSRVACWNQSRRKRSATCSTPFETTSGRGRSPPSLGHSVTEIPVMPEIRPSRIGRIPAEMRVAERLAYVGSPPSACSPSC